MLKTSRNVYSLSLILFISFSWLPFSPPLTPAEEEYWKFQNAKKAQLFALPKSLNVQGTSPPQTFNIMRNWAKSLVIRPREIVQEMKQYNTPELFIVYQKHLINMCESIVTFSPEFGSIMEDMIDAVEHVWRTYGTGPEGKEKSEKVLYSFDKKITSMNCRYYTLLNTHIVNYKKPVDNINKILAQRPLGKYRKALSSVHVSFQPYMIPIAVNVNHKGEVRFAAAVAYPIPIGVVSFGSALDIKHTHTLTIVTRGKRHVYDMGNKHFVLDFSESECALNKMLYDGSRKNLTVIMNF